MSQNTINELDRVLNSIELAMRRFGKSSRQYGVAMSEFGKLIHAIEGQ